LHRLVPPCTALHRLAPPCTALHRLAPPCTALHRLRDREACGVRPSVDVLFFLAALRSCSCYCLCCCTQLVNHKGDATAIPFRGALFGGQFPCKPLRLFAADPPSACRDLHSLDGGLAGAAILVRRGDCFFETKARFVQHAGGAVAIVYVSHAQPLCLQLCAAVCVCVCVCVCCVCVSVCALGLGLGLLRLTPSDGLWSHSYNVHSRDPATRMPCGDGTADDVTVPAAMITADGGAAALDAVRQARQAYHVATGDEGAVWVTFSAPGMVCDEPLGSFQASDATQASADGDAAVEAELDATGEAKAATAGSCCGVETRTAHGSLTCVSVLRCGPSGQSSREG